MMEFTHEVLFKSQISRRQLMGYIQRSNGKQMKDQITVKMKKASEFLNTMIHLGSKEQQIFFSNYQALINIVYESRPQIASNLALHRINIYAQRLIEANNPKKAKRLLESVFSYLHQSDIDFLLLSSALNNLSFLYFFQKDFELCLDTNIKNIAFCQKSIKKIQAQKNKSLKSYIQSLSIVLINSLKLTNKILSLSQNNILIEFFQPIQNNQIEMQENQNFLQQSYLKCHYKKIQHDSSQYELQQQKSQSDLEKLKKIINNLGYQACIKYLGQESYFCKFFDKQTKQQKSFKETQIQTDSQEEMSLVNQYEFNLFQSQTIKKLDDIYDLLRQNLHYRNNYEQKNEETQNNFVLSTKHSQQIMQFEDQHHQDNQNVGSSSKCRFADMKRNQDPNYFYSQQQIIEVSFFDIENWNVQIKYFKSTDYMLGKLSFKCKNIVNNYLFFQNICQRQLLKILSLRSLQDTLPYEYSLKEKSFNFLQVCIRPYLLITQNRKIYHLPRAIALNDPSLVLNFLSSKCYAFFFHIRVNNFRIAISPIQESGSIYLNVKLSQKSMDELFEELIEPIPQNIKSLFQNQLKKKNKKIKNQESNKKSIILKNLPKLKSIIQVIVKGFQSFLSNQEHSAQGNDIFGWISKDQDYWKFNEQEQNKLGIFIRVKFNKNNGYFNIYGEQSNFSHQKNISFLRKGSFEFSNHQFRQVFGFQPHFEMIKDKIKRIEEILSDKYTFKKIVGKQNQQMLSKNSQSKFSAINFMVDRSFNQQNFYVDFIADLLDPSYLCIVTASVVTLSSIFPVGIKISLYNPEKVETKAFFIDIFSQNWNYKLFEQQKRKVFNCQSPQLLNKTQIMFKSLVQKYPQEQNYFITLWLKIHGFKSILSKVLDPKSSLYFQKNLNSIVNWEKIFQE